MPKVTITKRRNPQEIQSYILNNVSEHPKDIGRLASEHFQVSRSAISKHLQALQEQDLLSSTGVTKDREYRLFNFVDEVFQIELMPDTQESVEWRVKIAPLLKDMKKNVIDICHHGFTEMFNNAIDHSGSEYAVIFITINAVDIEISIWDTGVGIFNKIKTEFNLEDPRHALLELSKGKLTTDNVKHSGEGIFFTSRMFDEFSILSDALYFARLNKKDDWLIEVEERNKMQGTRITMTIRQDATQTDTEVLNSYKREQDEYGFTRTHVALQLLKYEGEELISRSQAKRLLSRVNRFKEVFLDFKGVSKIGQAFADEIFRVYSREHPEIHILAIRTTPEIDSMIARVMTDQVDESKDQMKLI